MKCSLLYRRIIVLTVLACVVYGTSGCGRSGGGASDSLSVYLVLPEGEQPELFWYGVDRRALSAWREDRLTKEWSWTSGTEASVDLKEEDMLRFRGTDRGGRVLVEGSAAVGGEKKVSIPLRRVL